MDGIPALGLWDLVIDVLHFPTKKSRENPLRNNQTMFHVKRDDYVSEHAQSSPICSTMTKSLVSKLSRSLQHALSSSASNSPEKFTANSQNLGLVANTGKPGARDLNENDASSPQVRQSDVNLNISTARPRS